jgi:hypothetical protein
MSIAIKTRLPEKTPTDSEILQRELAAAECHELVFASNNLSKYE